MLSSCSATTSSNDGGAPARGRRSEVEAAFTSLDTAPTRPNVTTRGLAGAGRGGAAGAELVQVAGLEAVRGRVRADDRDVERRRQGHTRVRAVVGEPGLERGQRSVEVRRRDG